VIASGHRKEPPRAAITPTGPEAALADAKAREAGFASVEDYLRGLIRREADAHAELLRTLEEGERSGVSDRTVEGVYARVTAAFLANGG
jgi:hypothetical protein